MRVVNAIFDYRPLWDTMRKNGVSQYQLPCVSATQGDFSAVLYILLSITEHFALRRDSLLPTAVDQRTSARYAGAAATRGPHAIRCTTIRTILVFAWYTATVFSAPQPRRKS